MLENLLGGGGEDNNMILIILLVLLVLGGGKIFGGGDHHHDHKDKDGFLGGLFEGDNIIWILIAVLFLSDIF